MLTQVVPLSKAEQDMVIGWQDPPAWDSTAGTETAPPGRGNFLIKVGGRPGIPVHVALTPTELASPTTLAPGEPHQSCRGARRRRGERRSSMSATSRRSGGGPAHETELVLLWIEIGLFVLVGGSVTGAAHLGARIDDDDKPLPANPFGLIIGLVDGSVARPASATLALIILAVALTLLATLVVYLAVACH